METVEPPTLLEPAPVADPQVERFVESWRAPVLNRGAVRVGVALAILSLCLIRAYAGLSGVRIWSHDAFGALDGAWRVLNGQTPHADFYTPLGPVIYMVTAFGLWLSGGGAEGLGYSQACAGGLAGMWMLWLASGRVRHWPAILLCAVVVLISVNPTSVGEPPLNTSCMFYNRYGYALMALLLMEAPIRPEAESRRSQLLGGVSSGVVLGMLLFLKVSYFVAGLLLVAALVPCRKQIRDRWVGMCGSLGVAALAFWAFLGFRLGPMWNDLQMAAGAKPVGMNWFIVGNLGWSAAYYLSFVFVAAGLSCDARIRRQIRYGGLVVYLVGVFLLSTNFQFWALPLNTVMTVVILDAVYGQPECRKSNSLAAGVLLWGGLLVLCPVVYDLMGLGFAVHERMTWSDGERSSFRAPVLAGFQSLQREYVDFVNEGFTLIGQHRREGETIMSLDFSNPFSYGLGIKPAPGGATALHYLTNFNGAYHPPAEQLFGQADLVIAPNLSNESHLPIGIARIYGSYLATHFGLIGESRGWRLYRRNP